MASKGNVDTRNMGIAYDEAGNPVIVVRDQGEKSRIIGLEAQKSNIEAARAVATIVRTSLGPKGMDKMLVSSDGAVTISNDGATIMASMDVAHEIGQLLVELSRCQDDEIGDGTTGVVVLAGALLDQAIPLMQKGVHPIRIADSYDKACDVATRCLNEVATTFEVAENDSALLRAARTSLGSKIINRYHDDMAAIAVKAVRAVWDEERHDADFSRIQMKGKVGGTVGDTELVQGIVITSKEFSHPQMPRNVPNARIAVMNVQFEAPKPKTDYTIDIDTREKFQELARIQSDTFLQQVAAVKEAGADVVLCQWGFEDEANDLLARNGISAVRFVSSDDMEAAAIATNATIIARFEEMQEAKLGRANVYERAFGTVGERAIVLDGCAQNSSGQPPVVTVLVRGGNQMIVDEGIRSLHDAMCVVRNLLRDPRVVPGGGAAELACSLAVADAAANLAPEDVTDGLEHYCMEAFCDALDTIPQTLARNSGLSPIDAVATAKSRQAAGEPVHGVDCMRTGETDMIKAFVWETLSSKVQQIRLATQVCRMILKIDEVNAHHPPEQQQGH